jgi:PQQ-dependent dehydrogenase (s-GDH family)
MLKLVASAILLASLASLASAQDPPSSVRRGTKVFKRSVVVSGLADPWEITWGPDGKLWTTERVGKRITRIDPKTGEEQVAATIDEVSAPGGQDGLLGLALEPNTNNVYVFYTYQDQAKGPDPMVKDPNSIYRFLYGKIVRFTFNPSDGTLSGKTDILTGLPAGNDHNGGRLKFGPDRKLYLTLGDQGNNQLGNFCLPVEPQRLPTAKELAAKEFASYVGKSLRINLDGSIPKDNPKLNGVVSHVYTYGHRNPQGLDFAPDGQLYSSEHGPKTDDEVNRLVKGGNYGWPNVAGFRDGKAFQFARWADATTPCEQLKFSDLAIHPSVPRHDESEFKPAMVNPLATMFTVETGFNFEDPACKGINYICWPTVGASGVEHYQSKGIPGWDRVLLVTTLKRGSLYVLPLTKDGKAAAGKFWRYFQSENRYRDTAVSPDGKTIYIATDPSGLTESADGGVTRVMQDKGAILAFTYEGEGTGAPIEAAPSAKRSTMAPEPILTVSNPIAPHFTAAQAAAGKTAYNSNCAVCHGANMTNGHMGTPLAGTYFKSTWTARTVKQLHDRAKKTMPPGNVGSLPADVYTTVTAYILETNGFKAGDKALTLDAAESMVIK